MVVVGCFGVLWCGGVWGGGGGGVYEIFFFLYIWGCCFFFFFTLLYSARLSSALPFSILLCSTLLYSALLKQWHSAKALAHILLCNPLFLSFSWLSLMLLLSAKKQRHIDKSFQISWIKAKQRALAVLMISSHREQSPLMSAPVACLHSCL